MILHIFNNQEKFSKGFFQMLYDNDIDLSEHKLYHYGKKKDHFEKLGLDTHFLSSWFNPIGHGALLKDMKKADKIIVHSLASPFLLMYLFMFRKLNKKVYWMVWGKDLYIYHNSPKKNIFLNIYEFFRKPVIKNIGYIVTAFEEDFDKAKQWYDVKGKNIICHMFYPNSVDYSNMDIKSSVKDKYTVLLGNSGSKTNKHLGGINKLKKVRQKVEKVYIPLSYGGSKKYALKVKDYGEKVFGEKCKPLMDFMPFEEYMKMIDSVDIAFFNHNRQEAVGNMYSMILKGKSVYLNKEATTYQFLKRVGICVGEVSEIGQAEEMVFHEETLKKNQEILLNYINKENAIKEWKDILYN